MTKNNSQNGVGEKLPLVKGSWVIIGILLGLLFWILSSMLHVYVFEKEMGRGLLDELFSLNLHALFVRGIVLALLVGFGIFAQVMTARQRKMQEDLRETEERFRTFFDHAPIGKSMTSRDGKLIRVNSAFGEMLGYTIEEMQKVNFTEITHPDDIAESKECVRALLAGECNTWKMEKRYIGKNGDIVWTGVSTRLRRDESGEPSYFLTHIVNITEQKEAAERLIETNNRVVAERNLNDAVINSLPGVFYHFDENLQFQRWNKNFEKISGYTFEEFSKISPLDLFDEDDAPTVAERIKETFVKGESIVEANLLSKNGGKTPFHFTGIKAEINGRTSLIGIGIDISDRKRYEDVLETAKESLEQRVLERTEELASVVSQ